MRRNFVVLSMAIEGKGFSGGDRIFIEFSKRLIPNNFQITIITWEEGFNICKSQGLTGVFYEIWKLGIFKNLGFYFTFLFRIIFGIYYALNFKIDKNEKFYLYCASDFWPDTIPSYIIKLRYKNAILISCLYLIAPNPFRGFNENSKKIVLPKLRNIFFYLMQIPIKYLITKVSNFICVTSEPDKNYFAKKGFPREKIMVIIGGINFPKIPKNQILEKYEGIFYGRFHPQKGALELIDIWKQVTEKLPSAKLLMIGSGVMENQIKEKIKRENLGDNIILTGYLEDGTSKTTLFQQSKIVIHPALYDSGGMASAEIMYFNKPGISYNLEALKTYYAKGMIKIPCFDQKKFAEEIIKLLENQSYYKKMANEAHEYVIQAFDWNKKVKYFIDTISKI